MPYDNRMGRHQLHPTRAETRHSPRTPGRCLLQTSTPPCGAMRLSPDASSGFVANFAEKVMTGQLPLSVRRLSGERVELFGRSEALFPSLNHHLFFLDHVHEFDPN